MKTVAIAVAAALLAGCGSRTPVTDAVIAGLIVYSAVEYSSEPRPMPGVSAIYDWRGGEPVPPLAPQRRVREQDCSQPLEDPSANLKCR